jgi:hypothetical protein
MEINKSKKIIHGKININSRKLGQIESQFGTFSKRKNHDFNNHLDCDHINYLKLFENNVPRDFCNDLKDYMTCNFYHNIVKST